MASQNKFGKDDRVTETISFPRQHPAREEAQLPPATETAGAETETQKSREEPKAEAPETGKNGQSRARRKNKKKAPREASGAEKTEKPEPERPQKEKKPKKYSPLRDPDHTLNVLILPITLFLLFVFFTVCFVMSLIDAGTAESGTGLFGTVITNVMRGLFGHSALIFLPVLLCGAFRWRRDVALHRTVWKTVFAVLGVLLCAALFYTFGMSDPRDNIASFYARGEAGEGGGFLGSLLGLGLNALLGNVGTAIIAIVLLIFLVIGYVGIDIRALVVEGVARVRRNSEARRVQRAEEKEIEQKAKEEENEARRVSRLKEKEEALARKAEERNGRKDGQNALPGVDDTPVKDGDFFDDDTPAAVPSGQAEKERPHRAFRFVDVDVPFDDEDGFRESKNVSRVVPEEKDAAVVEHLSPVATSQEAATVPLRRDVPEELREEAEPITGPVTFEKLASITVTEDVPVSEEEPEDVVVDPGAPSEDPARRRPFVMPEEETDPALLEPDVEDGDVREVMPEAKEEPGGEEEPEVLLPSSAEKTNGDENVPPVNFRPTPPPVQDNPFAYVPVHHDPVSEQPSAQTEDASGAVHINMDMVVVKTRISESDGKIEEDPENAAAPVAEPVKREYHFPPLELLKLGNVVEPEDLQAELDENAQKLVDTLNSFNVPTHVVGVSRGARITRYELVPETGVRVRSIANLADDITMNMASEGIRIEAPIPGKPAVGIEVPNKKPETVFLRQLVSTAAFREAKTKTTVCLGSDVTGDPVYADLAKMPHLLVAGATGMGKSVCINTIITSILYKADPDEVKLILVDPKKVEFNMYSGIPHLLVPVVTDAQKAAAALNWAVKTMEERFDLIEQACVRDIKGYNASRAEHPERPYMSSVVIIIDELNDLMLQARDSVETSICRIAQKARAAGIHLIIGTQRPSVDVITGVIKANIPSRIAFHVSQQVDSRTILDNVGAEKLLNNGDMLYYSVGFSRPKRVQGAFISDDEVAAVVGFLKEQGGATYDETVMSEIEREAERAAAANQKKGSSSFSDDDGGSDDGDDPEFYEAVEIAIDAGKVSTSYLQRKMSIGYGKAAKLIDRMQEKGIVSEPEGQKPRNVLITHAELEEMRLRNSD